MRDEEPKLRVRQCFQTGTCSLKTYTVLKVIPHNYAAKAMKVRGIHGSPTVLAGLKFRLLVADTIRMVIFMSKSFFFQDVDRTNHHMLEEAAKFVRFVAFLAQMSRSVVMTKTFKLIERKIISLPPGQLISIQ